MCVSRGGLGWVGARANVVGMGGVRCRRSRVVRACGSWCRCRHAGTSSASWRPAGVSELHDSRQRLGAELVGRNGVVGELPPSFVRRQIGRGDGRVSQVASQSDHPSRGRDHRRSPAYHSQGCAPQSKCPSLRPLRILVASATCRRLRMRSSLGFCTAAQCFTAVPENLKVFLSKKGLSDLKRCRPSRSEGQLMKAADPRNQGE